MSITCVHRHLTAFALGIDIDGEIEITHDTGIIETWCELCNFSRWYFTAPFNSRVYLKVGWNLFGRGPSNNIEINCPGLQPTEFCVHTADPFSAPVVYDMSGKIMLNDVRLCHSIRTIATGSRVGLLAPNKIILFQFFNGMY